MTSVLDAVNLTFSYDDQPVINELSLSMDSGEVVALFGPNGSGKSTLIQLLLGARRGTGAVRWFGNAIESYRRRELARLIAYLPQTPTFDPSQRVAETINLGRLPYWGTFGIEAPCDSLVLDEVTRQLELQMLLDRRMDELSGGQRQRVLLARCLVQQPKALLLDEPSTFLDLRHQLDLLRQLRGLARELDIAVLMASHDLNLAALHADRAIVLCDGVKCADGPPDTSLTPDLLQRVYGVTMFRVPVGGLSHLVVSPD